MSRRRGLTLVEMLLTVMLLSLVTTAFFTVLMASFDRSQKLDRRQEMLQHFLTFKEYAHRQLRNARLDLSHSSAQTLTFLQPYQEDTAYGRLNRVNSNEMTDWNLAQPRRLTQDGTRIVQQVDGLPDRVLWDLHAGGQLEFVLAELPLLRILVSGQTDQDTSAAPWKREFTIMMENYS